SRHCLLDLRGQLIVAVQGDQRRVDPRRQRDRELAAGADIHAKALFRDPAEHGAGAERLGRVVNLRVLAERVNVLARTAPYVRLVQDERRRAEPSRQVAHVDPAERQGTADDIPRRAYGPMPWRASGTMPWRASGTMPWRASGTTRAARPDRRVKL